MPSHDLNILYTSNHADLANTLLFAKELGYDTVAIAIALTENPASNPPVIPVSTLKKPDGLRVLTRLTLTISDTSQNYLLPSLTQKYDIIALRPTSEKTLQQCCSNLECDIISLDFSWRMQYHIKFGTVSSALQRGIRFEICYSNGIVSGNDARRNLIAGATQLIRATRGRGIIISSEARSALGLRGPSDMVNLARVWGLSPQIAKEAVCEETEKVVTLSGMKRTSHRLVANIIDGGSQLEASVNDNGGTERIVATTQDSRPQSTDARDSKQKSLSTGNGAKRKASASSPNPPQIPNLGNENSLSKGQKKRKAKKARMEGDSSSIATTNSAPKAILLQHETLMSAKPK